MEMKPPSVMYSNLPQSVPNVMYDQILCLVLIYIEIIRSINIYATYGSLKKN